MKCNVVRGLAGLFFFAMSALSMAEDIDLFVKNEGAAGEVPNVLLVLDNGANFSASADFAKCSDEVDWPTAMLNTTGGIEQCALYKVIKEIPSGTINLGVMVFNAKNMLPSCTGDDGGCLVYPLTAMTDDNKGPMLEWIKSWRTSGSTDLLADTPVLNIKSNNNKNGAVMQEAWAFFNGRKGLSGTEYKLPTLGSSCNNSYVIFVGNSFNNSGSPSDGGNASPKGALEGTLADAQMNALPAASALQKAIISGPKPVSCEGGGSFTFSSSNHENNGYYADEWARYMRSQNITTYAIGLLSSACKKSYEALLQSMAEEGDGTYFRTSNFDELTAAFESALSEIQSINSVFASVSLPVSVNTQGTYLNQVFVGMFRPDEKLRPRWFGNLKQYKLGYPENSTTLRLLDADGNGAISSGDSGFISENARSFWTPEKSLSSTTLYWADINVANSIGYLPQSETPDGNMVEKGGQSYKLRHSDPDGRKVLTALACDSTSCSTSLAAFDAANTAITNTALGEPTMTVDQRAALIDWVRGKNVGGESIANSTLDASGNVTQKTTLEASVLMRPSSHGDVVHSRPVAINFATDNSPKVVVFYGANDGILRAVNGNRDGGNQVGNKDPGEELWSFVAPESYGIFSRLKADAPSIKYPNVTVGEPKDYGFDGPVTAYKSSSSAWVFASMRRGGRMLYAFDVPDSNPANPTLKWRVGCPSQENDDNCTKPAFTGIGQTWAVPTVLKSAGYVDISGAQKPMLLMGGGYDRCEDDDPDSCDGSSKGRAIYLLDADTGKELNTFDSSDVVGDMGSVIGDVTVVKDSNGLATYAYAADLSGNVYRISGGANAPIGSVAPGSWVITKIASLGGSGSNARKFMFGPDVVVENGVNYLLLGSGDREKPVVDYVNANSVQNYFFMLKDKPADVDWLASGSLTLGSLLSIPAGSSTPSSADLEVAKGWYLGLSPTEKVVTSGLTIFGTVYFSTHQPDKGLVSGCSAKLGESRAYSINFKTAEGLDGERFVDLVGDGLPPSPVAGLVTLDDGTTTPFCIGCGEKPLEGSEPEGPPSANQPKARVYWNIEQ